MKRWVSFVIALVAVLLPAAAPAGSHCVRPASDCAVDGDGTAWDCADSQGAPGARSGLPARLTRGDTYYVADGGYGGHAFDDPVSGTQVITVKKATLADHGSDAGWQAAYGDGQARWSFWGISCGYYVFDGASGSADDESSYGFHITPSSCDLSADTHLVLFTYGVNPGASHTEFRHIFFEGCGYTDPHCGYAIKSNAALGENRGSVIAHNLFYGNAVHLVLYRWSQTVVEHNFFDSNWSSPECHGEQVTFGNRSDDVVYRYNVHRNSTTGGLAVHDGNNNRWQVYGNVFYGGRVTMGVVGTADSGSTHPDVIKNWEVHNNTVYGVIGGGYGAGFFQGYCTDAAFASRVFNNLFVDTVHPVFNSQNLGCIEHDHNSFYDVTWLGGATVSEPHVFIGPGDPFRDAAGRDFRLATPTQPGAELPPPFDIDPDGARRGADGVWDRGAYEFVGRRPSPPAGLRAE